MVLLSATLIAIGNSLQDYFANSSMSALGYGVMAVTGTIAGQLFNFLIGFGLNMTKGCYHNGGVVKFDLFKDISPMKKKDGKFEIQDGVGSNNDSSIYSVIILLVVILH